VPGGRRWLLAIWDLGAFVFGLGTAWLRHWQATDLVWSLWLSSLVVGYATMLWTIGQMAWIGLRGARSGGVTMTSQDGPGPAVTRPVPTQAASIGVIFIALFFLGFFTVHFGGFHFVHSAFLNMFFPVTGEQGSFPTLATYETVFRRYAIFLPATFVAERAAFGRLWSGDGPQALQQTVAAMGPSMVAPYKNVVRMHLLIFFFIGASILHVTNLGVVAVVYFVYFFPWACFRR
jgi:hypothetical protein